MNAILISKAFHYGTSYWGFIQIYLPPTLIQEWNEPSCFHPQLQCIMSFSLVFISRPTKGRRLSWPRLLLTYRPGMPTPKWSPIPVPTNPQCGGRGSNSQSLSRKSDTLTTRLWSNHLLQYGIFEDKWHTIFYGLDTLRVIQMELRFYVPPNTK